MSTTLPADAQLAALTEELRAALAPTLQLAGQLGQGGMGLVFLARDPALKRTVVVKVLAPELAHDATARKRFEREAESAAAVTHPNVVSVFQVGTLPRSGTSYFVMQHVDGGTLEGTFPEGSVAPEARVRRIVGETASALAAAHRSNLIHRDIKPGNIMLERDTDRVIVLDFGISAARRGPDGAPTDTRLTVQGTSIGTPRYMSPEQAMGEEITPRSDVYSLGLVAYELLTGRSPFETTNAMALIAAHIQQAPPPVATKRDDLDTALATLVDRCLSKDPAKRPDADEIERALIPGRQATIEWPPPGTEPLRGAGRRFAHQLNATVVTALLAFTALALPVIGGLPSGDLQRAVRTTGLWSALAALIFIVALGGHLVLVAVRGIPLARHLARARAAGLPTDIALDVAWDDRPDTSSLINGLGDYALLNEAQRARVLRLRRLHALVTALTLAAGALGPALWMLGAFTSASAPTATVIPLTELALIWLPWTAGSFGLVVIGALERGILPRRRRDRRLRLPPLRPELMTGWLNARQRSAAPGSRVGRLTGAFAPLAAGLALTVFLFLLVCSSQLVGAIRSLNYFFITEDAGSLMRMRRASDAGWNALAANLEDVAGRATTTADTALPGLLVGYALAGRTPRPEWITTRTTPVDSVDQGAAGLDRLAVSMFGRPDTMLARIAGNARDPGLAYWRRLSRAAPLPMYWYFRDGELPEQLHRGRFDVNDNAPLNQEWRRLASILERLAMRNEAAAIIAANRGDRAGALARLRENVGAGRVLLDDPLLFDRAAAILDRTFEAMQRLGGRWNDGALQRDAAALRGPLEVQQRARRGASFGASLLWARPDHPAGGTALSDETLAPAIRVHMLHGIVDGFCANPRELLFGPDARRADLLTRSGVKLIEIGGAERAVASARRQLAQIERDPQAVASRRRTNIFAPTLPAPLTWIAPSGFKSRFEICGSVL